MSEWSETLVRVLLESSVRAAAIGVAAGIILSVLRIRSSSARHSTWVMVLAAMLLMPALLYVVPPISMRVQGPSSAVDTLVSYISNAVPATLPAEQDLGERTSISASDPIAPDPTPVRGRIWPMVIAGVYFAGVVLLSIRLVLGWRMMWTLIAGARELEVETGRVYESKLISTAVTIGVIAPRILLPATWSSWPKEKIRAILVHERAHIRRRDPLVNLFAHINCALFWFHPLSWWLQRMTASTAEHACDDVVLENVLSPKSYAEILLDIAQTVRRDGGRVSWQATGVDGNGLLGRRIDRILHYRASRTSAVRKIVLALSCAAAVSVAVACRDKSAPVSLPASIEVEEQRAVERLSVARARVLDQQSRVIAQQKLAQDARTMTFAQAAELETHLKKDPEDVQTRERLVYFYGRDLGNPKVDDPEKIIPSRRRHILWFIAHHPDADVLGTWAVGMNPAARSPLADPDGYAEAKRLWLSHTARPDVTLPVLENAASFFEVTDKHLAEQLLLRARAIDRSAKWSIWLGQVYALALLGVNDAITTSGVIDDHPRGILILSIGLTEARDPFAQHVREIMGASNDAQLLNSAAQYLMLHPLGVSLGTTYLERAVQLDAKLVSAHQRLLRLRLADRYPEAHAALRKVDKEAKYATISAMPEPARFVILREMAEYSYQESRSLEVLNPDGAKAARERSRLYAEDLLKLAANFRKDPGYSAAVFSADILAGSIAAQESKLDTALNYLRDASHIPSSEEMAYLPPFVPFRQLCTKLLDSGYRNDVIALLEHLAEINISQRDEILRMAANARAGKPVL